MPSVVQNKLNTLSSIGAQFEDGVALIRFGSEHISLDWLNTFCVALDELGKDSGLRGVALLPQSEDLFSVGLSSKEFCRISDKDHAKRLVTLAQNAARKLINLKCQKIAGIAGRCFGLAFDFALLCDKRVALNHPNVKFCLSDRRLGFAPYAGATKILPSLIGLPQAIEMIAGGIIIGAEEALELGLVNALVECASNEKTLTALEQVTLDTLFMPSERIGVIDQLKKRAFASAPSRMTLRRYWDYKTKMAVGGLEDVTKKCVSLCLENAKVGLESALSAEAEAFVTLACRSEGFALRHVLKCSESAREIGSAIELPIKESSIGVLGATDIGIAITVLLLRNAGKVIVVDPHDVARARAQKEITDIFSTRYPEEKDDALSRLLISGELSAINTATLVLETVDEDFELKKQVITQASKAIPKSIIISTANSLKIADISSDVVDKRRIVGARLYRSSSFRSSIEILRTSTTSDRAFLVAAALVWGLGRYPIICEDSTLGVTNRLLAVFFAEAFHLLNEGMSLGEIDEVAIKSGFRVGPFRLMDEIGVDVVKQLMESVKEFCGERVECPPFWDKLIAKGYLGEKTGRGFYVYYEGSVAPDTKIRELLEITKECSQSVKRDAQRRFLLVLMNEGVRCADDGCAGRAGMESAGQIDLASVMSLGLADHKGGVIFMVEQQGARSFVAELSSFAKIYGKRFEPSLGAMQRAELGKGFYM